MCFQKHNIYSREAVLFPVWAACKQRITCGSCIPGRKIESKMFSMIFTDTPTLLMEGHSMVSHDLEKDGKVDICWHQQQLQESGYWREHPVKVLRSHYNIQPQTIPQSDRWHPADLWQILRGWCPCNQKLHLLPLGVEMSWLNIPTFQAAEAK